MKLTETILEDYAKKIFGFAYEKVGNHYEAEELAQEIMLQLFECINKQKEIEHLSSFVYTVCCYTWSKYLRKNKKHWNYADIDEARDIAGETNIEAEITDKLLYVKLRKKISNLAKTHREIVVMHYYEGKTTSEIAKLLNMNDSTVRWYLSNIRDTLKEKLDMSENLDFRPASLCVGIDGTIENDGNFRSIENDLLVQNIALVCYGEPLTITEISERLNVAAAYLEKHIEHMVYMDFLKQQGKKYQTNFFISNKDVEEARVRYGYNNAKSYADRIYDAVIARKSDILNIDYFGKDNVNEDYFMWFVLLKVAQEKAYEEMQKNWDKCHIERPFRKDGSEYWINASTRFKTDNEEKEFDNYWNYRCCNGYKINADENIGDIWQADTYFCYISGQGFRDVIENQKMIRLLHAEKALMKEDELNEFEKLYVSEFVREGYISIKEEKPISNIPVFTVEQMERLNKIIKEIKESLGEDLLKEYLDGYSEMMDKFIPKFLDKNIRNYHKYAIMGGFDMFAHMIMEAKNGGKCKLELPDEEGAKHAMTWLVVK